MQFSFDVDGSFSAFPVEIAASSKRPDIIIYCFSMHVVILIELTVPLRGEVRPSSEPSASGLRRQPIAKSGKFVRRACSQTALDCEKTTVLCFPPSWSTLLFERGLGAPWGKRDGFDGAARSQPPKPSCQCHKQRQLRLRRGPSKGAHTYTRTKDQKKDIASTRAELKWKKGIKLILKTFGNRKGDCA